MKKLLFLLPVLIISLGVFGQRKTIPQKGGGWYYINNGTSVVPMPVNPGDTVMMDPSYEFISLNDVHGLPGKPIVFMGVSGKTKVGFKIKDGRGASILTQRCSYIKFFNVKAGNDLPGVYNAQGWNIQASHNIEIGNVEIYKSEVGFFTNQLSGHYPNIYIHDVEGHDINNADSTAFGELFYVGQTSGKKLEETSLPNLRIENVKAWNIGGDVIQLANCINASVKNVWADGYGLNKVYNQWYGLLVGGGTSGTFENLHFKNGSGKSFEILGTGEVTIKNCTSENCGWVNNVQDAFYIRQSFPTLRVHLIGNKVDRTSRNWIYEVTPGLLIENIGNQFGVPIPPVVLPPARVDSVTKASYDSLNKDWQDRYQVALDMYKGCEIIKNSKEQQVKDLETRLAALKAEIITLSNKY